MNRIKLTNDLANSKGILLIAIALLLFVGIATAQTPGMIIKAASGAGAAVLDPNGDGYVSQKSNGVQLGFTNPPNNDVAQSEIPYVQLIKPDPVADIYAGPVGSFNEIIGVDAAGNNAILSYADATNVLYRFRMDWYNPNSKSYSILIDVDGKFGFTGVNADPNAVAGNPGFEVEINLVTNFSVNVYNVNGKTMSPTDEKNPYYTASWTTNCQQSVAVTQASGDIDFFYDFYLPFSAFSGLFTSSSTLRYAAVTSMNTHASLGNPAISDVGGASGTGSTDNALINIINSQTPTVPGGAVLTRSDCPPINAVSTTSTTISGTSTEASGTSISVKVYSSDGVTLLGSTTTTTSGSTWSINVSSLSPTVTLANNQIVRATATASGEGTSIDNCSSQIVTSCAGATSTSGVTITKISGSKGYSIANSFPTGTIFTWYNADFTVANYSRNDNANTPITNPQTSTASSQTIDFSTQTGQSFPAGVYYFTFKEPTKCVSSYLQDCQYSTVGTSSTPVITTSPITTTTTTISGTCANTASTLISLKINGITQSSTTVSGGTSWSFTGLNLTTRQCDTITVSEGDAGKCPTTSAISVISRQATTPSITGGGCYATVPVTSISGTSNEDDGATITLYNNSGNTVLGTGTVSGGNWTVSSLSLAANTVVYAKVTSGSCVRTSDASATSTIVAKTNISGYTITITAPTAGASSVSGTISGGTYPVTLKLYEDQTLAPDASSGITVSAAGAWSVTGLSSLDLYTDGILNVTLTSGSSCESALSSATATVVCSAPTTPSYTGGSNAYCSGSASSITLTTSQLGVIYQLVDGSGTAVGPSKIGTGGSITLFSNTLTSNQGPWYVKAYKFGRVPCSVTGSTAVYFNTINPTPWITLSSTALTVLKGTTSLNLPYSAKSITSGNDASADQYTIDYSLAAEAQGFADITSATNIPASNIPFVIPAAAVAGKYDVTLTISSTTGASCTRSYGFTITVYEASNPPVISVHPANATICSGTTTTLTVTAVNATSYQWQSASTYSGSYSNVSGGSGATTASYTTPTLTSKTFYRVIVTNANGSVTSDPASVFVTPTLTAGSITGTTPVCAGTTNTYSISAVTGATSYTWSYSGPSATLTPSSNSVSIAFNDSAAASSGTLSVTANNDCGAGTAATLSITVNPKPVVSNMTKSACSGVAFTVTPVNSTNGVVPTGTTYSWSAPVVTGSITGGASGSGASSITGTLTNTTGSAQTATYTVTPVKGSCTGATFTVVVTVNSAISLTSISQVNIGCFGGSTGSINLSPSGGTPPYTYAWTGPSSYSATTQNISGRVAGAYSVTVTDASAAGCTAITSATLTQPSAAISITPSLTHVTCNGASTGAISLSVSGGTSPYTYLWADGSTSQNQTGLVAGSYSVTVTDANGCTAASGTQTLTQATVISASASGSAISCNGGTSTITVTASGGTGTLQYKLNTGSYQLGNTFASQTASATPYTITVKDDNNCTVTTTTTITQPAALAIAVTLTDKTCTATSYTNNGAINITVSGGTTAYNYDWSDVGGTSNSEDRTGLAPGSYTITVTDANSCTIARTYTISTTYVSPATPGTITK